MPLNIVMLNRSHLEKENIPGNILNFGSYNKHVNKPIFHSLINSVYVLIQLAATRNSHKHKVYQSSSLPE